MRQIVDYRAKDGTVTYRVRYRDSGGQHSETFRHRKDSETFAQLLDVGTTEALRWLHSRRGGEREDDTTFGQWFGSYLHQLTGIQSRTRDDYEAMHRRYLTELDPLPLPLITRAHVAGIVNGMERDGLSPKTIKNAIHMLSSVMALAVEEGHVPRNPVKRVRLPKQQTVEHEERFLSYDEAGALVAATPEHYQPLVTFLLGTGLRWSEATALQTRHINLDAGTVRVQRAWKRIRGGWEIGPPKSSAGNRTVNAGVPALLAVAPLLGKANDFVFTTPLGNVVRHSNFYNRIWVPSCRRADLATDAVPYDGPTIHDTRHTFASWLISDGHGLEVVQKQLGHESIITTQRYAKLLPAVGVAAGKSASAAMERVLAIARGELPDLGVDRALEPVRDPH